MKYLIPLLLILAACTNTDDDEVMSIPKAEDNPKQALKAEKDITNKKDETISNETEMETEVEKKVSAEYQDMDWESYENSMTKDYSYVIVMSTKNYDDALKRAKEASKELDYTLNLRALHPNAETGLALPAETCESICGGGVVEYPCYLPRVDWRDTKYVSVEYSDAYEGFTKGYFIVIVASGAKNEPEVKEALKEARSLYSDAYIKTCGVFMGCGC